MENMVKATKGNRTFEAPAKVFIVGAGCMAASVIASSVCDVLISKKK